MNLVSSIGLAVKKALLLIVGAALVLGLALCATCSVLASSAQAATAEYQYTVRVFSGAQGTFNGQESVTLTTSAKPGDRISFNQGAITLNNGSKYYIKGVRLSGRDNDTSTTTPSFVVTGDTDLVVSYGILGDNVAYTVRYVDEGGQELAPTETFYGNVGDRPVIAYRYIDGYTPQAYNLTGKLSSDPEKNVYTFTYTATQNAGTQEPENPGQGGAGAGGPGDNGGDGGDGQGAGAGAVEPQADIPDEENPLANPDELQDIRDEENPLGSFLDNVIGDEAFFLADRGMVAAIGSIAAAILLVIALFFIFRSRRRQRDLSYGGATSGVSDINAKVASTGGNDSSDGSADNGGTA